MIDNPAKVKDLIKNLANGDSGKAQLLQRRYAMEHFLERTAESEYKNKLVLRGGMLVTSMLDLGQRMTRDTDVTMLDMTLDVESSVKIAKAIAAIPLKDGMTFDVEDAYEIMEDSEYGGIRIEIRAHLGKMDIPMKLDISTGDALTPSAISYTRERKERSKTLVNRSFIGFSEWQSVREILSLSLLLKCVRTGK